MVLFAASELTSPGHQSGKIRGRDRAGVAARKSNPWATLESCVADGMLTAADGGTPHAGDRRYLVRGRRRTVAMG